MRSFTKHAFSFSAAAAFTTVALGACAFYENAGRQAIEKDEGGLVTTVSFNGFAGQPLHAYSCERGPNQPEYLKEPLEVVETEHESRGISVMTPVHALDTAASWVAVHRHDEQAGAHTHCKISPLQSTLSTMAATLAAARIGVDQLVTLESAAARQ